MTVSVTTNTKAYFGNGVTRNWDFTFYVLAEGDMNVYLTNLTTNITTLVVANYDVDLLNSYVTYPTVASGLDLLTSNYKITLERKLDILQASTYPNQGDFPSLAIETSEDKAIMICQQLQEQLSRLSLKDIGTGEVAQTDVASITFTDGTIQYTAGVGSANSVYADDGTEVLDGGTDGTDSTYIGEIIGKTNGSSVPTGKVGEVIEYIISETVTGSTTLGEYTDLISDCELTAGNWEITIYGSAEYIWASGTGFVTVSMALTNNSNTVIERSVDGTVNELEVREKTIHYIKYFVNLTENTTYKVRFAAIAMTLSPVISSLSAPADSITKQKFIAKRIS